MIHTLDQINHRLQAIYRRRDKGQYYPTDEDEIEQLEVQRYYMEKEGITHDGC